MAIVTGDLLRKYSVKTGSAGNSTAGTASGSLGKYISTSAITSAVLNNLFDDVSGDENAASEAEYRCEFIHNSHATLTLQAPKAWISSEVAGGASVAIGADTTAASALANASAQALEVTNEDTAPSGVTFSAPTTKAAGVALSDLAAGNVKALW